jgi:hypothetical protein
MGYRGITARIPFDKAGFQPGRDTEFLLPFALVEPTCNVNFHEGGISKRGGTQPFLTAAITGTPAIRGLFQFRKQNGTDFLLFADANGKVYYDGVSNILKSGLSTSNYFSFSVFDDEVFICDGANIPQYWDGSAANTSAITGVATSWASDGYPFQGVPHSNRMAYINKKGVYLSDIDNAKDASDANVKYIPIYSESGLVGGYDWGGTLFAFSKTKAYIVDDSDLDPDNWGYREAIWEGGVAHWRLITKAGNNLYLMSDEGFVYTLQAVQATGDYQQVNLTRPAYIDRWIRQNVTKSNVEAFSSVYDRSLRAITYFVQVGGVNTNTGLKYFIERPPEVAWVPHNNTTQDSGFKASVSTEVRTAIGEYKIYTGDFSGQIWKHEQTEQSDNDLDYNSTVKLKPLNMDNPRMYKHFREGRIRAAASGNFTLTIRVWVDGSRKEDIDLTFAGSGALFGSAILGTSVFASDSIVPVFFDLGYYGFDIQFEILNSTAGQDFFLSELLIDFKEMAARTDR